MFKLTYQAYIMFGMTMIYAIFRLLIIGKNKILKVLAFIGLFFFVWACGYFGNSVHSWFGEVWKPSQYKGLNATAFLETDFPEDVNGIRWLKENISDAPVVLEANGDSYSEYERVSAMTGLPTIMGWYVHEWLWRGNLSDLNAKIEEIQVASPQPFMHIPAHDCRKTGHRGYSFIFGIAVTICFKNDRRIRNIFFQPPDTIYIFRKIRLQECRCIQPFIL